MRKIDAVVIDLAFDLHPTWAVIIKSKLLPVRFSREGEAESHLAGLLEAADRHPAQSEAA